MTDLLANLLNGRPSAYALLHRPETTGDNLDVLVGSISTVEAIDSIPLPDAGDSPQHQDVLAVIPFQQIRERGYAATDDHEPLITMRIEKQSMVELSEVVRRLPNTGTTLENSHFDVTDEEYAAIVENVVETEIGRGEGANFVIRRSFVADITDYSPRDALSFYRRLLEQESGAYWTLLIHTGERTFVGASPERHISVRGGTAVMNPISGTYRYPNSGPALPEVMEFLADQKESDELCMVVDEELKMMAQSCEQDIRVVGPFLKEMTRLAHTEYFIEGRTSKDVRDILRDTMFAPTVTGSPLENACKVIQRHEPEGRGYYSGVIALFGQDEHGDRTLDSAIAIRTADIDSVGRVRIGVGATLVRHSDPASEVAETRAKAAGLLSALTNDGPRRFANHPQVREALERRNESIAGFWLRADNRDPANLSHLAGRTVLVIDAEDTFTSMIGHQLRSIGLNVTVSRFDEPHEIAEHDLVVMGPGPGDPRRAEHAKIAQLRATMVRLLEERRPFLAICLSHQILSDLLDLPLVQRETPNQGVQSRIDLFGQLERVGFYNTFAALAQSTEFHHPLVGSVECSRDSSTGEVHGLRGPGFASVQFHPESVLTSAGPRILGALMTEALSISVA